MERMNCLFPIMSAGNIGQKHKADFNACFLLHSSNV